MAALEFGLMLPVFLLLLAGLAEGAWLFQQANAVEKGLRAGALFLARSSDPFAAAAEAAARNIVKTGNASGGGSYLAPGWADMSATLSIEPGSFLVGEVNVPIVIMTARIPFKPLMPDLAAMFGLTGQTIQLQHEQAYVGD